jgi:hypothetical protein
MYRNNQNMIAIVAIWRNVVGDSSYLSLPSIEGFHFNFSSTMEERHKSTQLLLRLNYVLKKYSQKRKTGRVVSSGDSRLSARSANRRLVKKPKRVGRLAIVRNATPI